MQKLNYDNMVRQGEVLLIPIYKKQLPKNLTEKDNILAHGSATGHSHILDNNASVTVDAEGNQYVTVTKTPAQLTHEEHTAITVQKGTYQVKIQRERDLLNDEIRAVRD